jgi:type I restriction enzyme S subunit
VNAVPADKGWKSYRLCDVVTKLVDGSHNPPPKQDQGRPMLSARNVDQGRINFDEFRYISNESFDAEHARTRVAPGDVLLTIVGTIGRSAVVPEAIEPFALQRSVAVLSPKDSLLSKFLAYQFQSPRIQRYFEQHARGTAQKGVYLKTLGQTPILVPPVADQEAVVAELEKQLSRLDEAVANLKRVKANLKRYKVAVLVAAVKGQVQSGEAASSEELPAGWKWTTVGELATVGTGATPARGNEAFYRGGTIPWITSSAVNEPFVDSAEQFVTDEALRRTNLTLYPPGTLLVAMYGEGKTRGKCSELRIAATTNQALAALQAEPAVRPWLKLFFEHNYDNTRRIASGGVQPNLNLGLIRSIKLPVPPAEQQPRIVAEVDRRLSLLAEIERQVERDLHRAGITRASILSKVLGVAR